MTCTTDKTRAYGGASIWQRLNELWLDLAERIASHRLYRATKNELFMLSDRELSDMGIHRSMIDEIAIRATYKA